MPGYWPAMGYGEFEIGNYGAQDDMAKRNGAELEEERRALAEPVAHKKKCVKQWHIGRNGFASSSAEMRKGRSDRLIGLPSGDVFQSLLTSERCWFVVGWRFLSGCG